MNKYFQNPGLYAVRNEQGEFEFNNIPYHEDYFKEFINTDNGMTSEEITKLIEERNTEFIKTPFILTWQDLSWPIIDGDYAVYIMPAGQAELADLAENKNGKDFLRQWIENVDTSEIDTGWETLKPTYINLDGKVDQNWPALIHIFKSTQTNKYSLIWDIL